MSTQVQDVSSALERVVAGLSPSLVSVLSHRMHASGFAWSGGLVVTSDEGVAEEGEVRVTLPGGDSMAASRRSSVHLIFVRTLLRGPNGSNTLL